MVRSKRLKPIKNLARSHEKSAAQVLAGSLDRQKQESNKFEQLNQYRLEYLAEMQEKIKIGLNGATLQQYYQFLSKLDMAIAQQRSIVEQCEADLVQSKNIWQEKRGKSKVISQVMEKLKTEEQQHQDKKETRQLDELSTQAYIRRQQSN